MKIFLSGQKSFGRAVFQLLEKLGHEIVGIAAPREDSRGRTDALFGFADLRRVQAVSEKTLTAADIPENTDLIVAAHSHAFIGRKTREKTTHGAIGYHPSLLPKHRGRDAVKWAIKMGDQITGGSVFWLNDSVDGGPIAKREWCFIHPDDDASSLWSKKLFPMGIALLAGVLADIENGKIVKIPQDETLATWEPALDAPRLYRPELIQLGNGKSKVQIQVESDFAAAMRLYAID